MLCYRELCTRLTTSRIDPFENFAVIFNIFALGVCYDRLNNIII